MSFHVTFISDSSSRFFPENKTAHFIMQLPSSIHLSHHEWEIGLTDIIYPHTCYNIRPANNLFGFDLGDGKIEGRLIPLACYETIADLLKAMTLSTFKNKIDFQYHPVTKRVTIKTKDDCKVILHAGIAELLGFNAGEFKGVVQSPFVADPAASFPVLYVYCDLVEPQIVGDVKAPLLKMIKVEGIDGEMENVHYTRPHYIPVIRQHFQTIEINLRLHSGNFVPFERGMVYIVLHFRMKQIV